MSTRPKAAAALDAEFYRVEEGWYWAIYAAGTNLCLADGASRLRILAAWQLRRWFGRLSRTANAEIAFLPVRGERA